ncbi:MAG: aminotransferase class V-fold PLP-dependent enzyme [Bacillota bacterium]|nr:MAG: aminotransferase class V-fold PLP-dependent enzyme [Bacillota bacterium]
MARIDSLAPRADFPALDDYTYLNSASISVMPLPAREAMEEFSRRILHAGTVSLDEEAEVQALELAREGAARLIGAPAENVAITTSATEGLDQLAWGLRPTGNIVSVDIEFPSVTYPWFRVARETGAEVRLVRRWDDPAPLCLDDVAALIDKETSVVCVSHVQYATGHRFDLGKLAALAHDKGALCIVDATQSTGVIPIDVQATGIDALVSASYKWLCGPFGAAVVYMAPHLFNRLEPVFVGWRGTADMWAFDARELTYAPSMRRYEYSTMSYPSGYGLSQALAYLENLDIEAVFRHVLRLTDLLMEGLERLGARLLTPRDYERRAGIVTARFPGHAGEAVAAELNRRGVIVSPRFGSTRFSPHFFNDSEDIERALAATADILHSRPRPSP